MHRESSWHPLPTRIIPHIIKSIFLPPVELQTTPKPPVSQQVNTAQKNGGASGSDNSLHDTHKASHLSTHQSMLRGPRHLHRKRQKWHRSRITRGKMAEQASLLHLHEVVYPTPEDSELTFSYMDAIHVRYHQPARKHNWPLYICCHTRKCFVHQSKDWYREPPQTCPAEADHGRTISFDTFPCQ